MPRLRYLSHEILTQLADSSVKAPASMPNRDELSLLNRAAQLILTAADYAELLGDVGDELTFRQIATRRSTSAATEWRRRPKLLAAIQQAYLAVRLTDKLGEGQGITLDPRSGLPLSDSLGTGYLVSIKQSGRSFRQQPTPYEALQWLQEQRACLGSYYPGAWIGDPSTSEKYCLDMNVWVTSETVAMEFAIEQKQQAIFDLRANSTLWVARRGQRKAG